MCQVAERDDCSLFTSNLFVIHEVLKSSQLATHCQLRPPNVMLYCQVKIFWGFGSELQTNPMPFHLDSPWGATLMPLRGRIRILRANKNSGLILSHMWTKVHESLGRRRGPLYFPKLLLSCLCHVSFTRYSPLSLEVDEKPNKCIKVFRPQFFLGGTTPTFLRQIVSAIYGPPFDKAWLSSVC